MSRKIVNTKFTGVRFRVNTSKRYQGRPDRYYFIRYYRGKLVEEGVGWASDGITPQFASSLREEIKANIKIGSGTMSLKEKRENEQKKMELEIRKNLSFDFLASEYLKWSKDNKVSWKDDRVRYNKHIQLVLGKRLIKNISPPDLEELKGVLKKKNLAPATIKQCLVLIRQIFNKAKFWGTFSGENPFKNASQNNPKFLEVPDNRRNRFLQPDEAEILLNELEKRSQIVYEMACMSLDTGIRRGELFKLTWQDVDLKSELIHIKDAKYKRNRQVFMTKRVRQILVIKKANDNENGIVFKSKNNSGINHIYKVFDRSVDKLGFNKGIKNSRDKVVFQTLRHTFASWLALNGVSLMTIKELGGWQSLSMVERYAHLIPNQEREAIAKIEQHAKIGFRRLKIN